MSRDSRIQQTLLLIESAHLERTKHKLLSLFMEHAADPTLAAEFLLNRADPNNKYDEPGMTTAFD